MPYKVKNAILASIQVVTASRNESNLYFTEEVNTAYEDEISRTDFPHTITYG